jgi:hypothetical protein
MLFASGSNGDDFGDYDDPDYDEPVQETRRNPGAPRAGGGGGGSGSGGGGGRQRTINFQPEERYWTEYLRIALPIIGLLLMIGLFWFWASQLTDDGDNGDDPVGTTQAGTTDIITPESTPRPTQAPVIQPTEPPASTPEAEATEPPADEETPAEETPASDEAEFAPDDYVQVVDGVNLRSEPSTEGEIVAELSDGEVLQIVSGPEEGEDYQWYEVIVESTGDTGYVASDFIEPAPDGE